MTTPGGVDVVLNANAGRLGGASRLRSCIENAARRAGATLHVTTSVDELDRVVRRIAEESPRAVVLAGGDGTHMAALSAFTRAHPGRPLPRIALLPGGTMNTVAGNFGAGATTRAAVEHLLSAIRDGSAREVPTPTLHVTDDRSQARVGFIFGTALVGRFFDAYYRSRTGPLAAAAITARIFAGSFVGSPFARAVLDPEPATLTVDGAVHPAPRWSLVLASVVAHLGLEMHPTYRARERADRFHVVASGLPPRALAAQLPRVLAGKALRGEPSVDALANELLVSFTRPDATYVLDGEVHSAASVRVSLGPAVTMLVV
ncbi:MAG: diacylglycerol/lipid kinase family protein [Polyangiaceae bacterium]